MPPEPKPTLVRRAFVIITSLALLCGFVAFSAISNRKRRMSGRKSTQILENIHPIDSAPQVLPGSKSDSIVAPKALETLPSVFTTQPEPRQQQPQTVLSSSKFGAVISADIVQDISKSATPPATNPQQTTATQPPIVLSGSKSSGGSIVTPQNVEAAAKLLNPTPLPAPQSPVPSKETFQPAPAVMSGSKSLILVTPQTVDSASKLLSPTAKSAPAKEPAPQKEPVKPTEPFLLPGSKAFPVFTPQATKKAEILLNPPTNPTAPKKPQPQ